MSANLQDWLNNGWLRKHSPARNEISDLFGIVERDVKDSHAGGISSDWSFGIAYNAALKLCTILLHASGYRPEKTLQHYRTLQALPLVLGENWRSEADYLESCRRKRNVVEYDRVGDASELDVQELRDFIRDFQAAVTDWLKQNHPDLL